MSSDQADAAHPTPKVCRICGKDLSQLRRVRDAQGRYRCPTCMDARTSGSEPQGSRPVGSQSEANQAALSDTPLPEHFATHQSGGGSGFNPALAETKMDVEAIPESAAAPPPFPERGAIGRSSPTAESAYGSSREPSHERPHTPDDGQGLSLAPARDGDVREYQGAIGPRKRIQWSTAEDDRQEAEAQAEREQAAAPPPHEIANPVDPNEIPEDRSGLYLRVRAGHLKMPAMLTAVGILAATGIAFGLKASPNETMGAINAAFNSGISAIVQAAAAVGVYALCCAIWVRPKMHWQLASVRLAAFSTLMAAGAIGLALVPKAGPVLLWALPLLFTVIVLRKWVLLSTLDSIYCGLLIYAAQLGVRIALDADLWSKAPLTGS